MFYRENGFRSTSVNASASAAEERGYLKQEGIETTMAASSTSCGSLKLIKEHCSLLEQQYDNLSITLTFYKAVGLNVLVFSAMASAA